MGKYQDESRSDNLRRVNKTKKNEREISALQTLKYLREKWNLSRNKETMNRVQQRGPTSLN